MPDGFDKKDLEPAPTRRDLKRIEKEWRAYELYALTGDYRKVRDQLPGVQTITEAKVWVNRGIERWREGKHEHANAIRAMVDRALTDTLRGLHDSINDGDLNRAQALVSVADRLAKMHDLDDARKDAAQVGVQIVVNTGLPDIPDVPVIEGTYTVQNELEAPKDP